MAKFQIYQINKGDNKFQSFKRERFEPNDYELVYERECDCTLDLDDIYMVFNVERPADFKGHSLSVSDVICIDCVFYYIDSFGFCDVTNLWKDK